MKNGTLFHSQSLSCHLKSDETRPNSLIDMIAYNNGYGWNNALFKLTFWINHLLSYLQSRVAIASKKWSNWHQMILSQCLVHVWFLWSFRNFQKPTRIFLVPMSFLEANESIPYNAMYLIASEISSLTRAHYHHLS